VDFAFGSYADEVLELLVEHFGPAYKHVFAFCWNNGFDARTRRSYARAYREDCLYEVYVPIAAHPSMNMQYYRIAVKVVPEISQQKAKELAIGLMNPRQRPNGIIDSESIFIVALRRRGWIHGFRHVKLPGYLTCIVVDRNPHEAIKTICRLIWRFLKSMRSGTRRTAPSIIVIPNNIINKLSYHIRQTIRCLSRFLDWLKGRAERLKAAEKLLSVLRSVRGLKEKCWIGFGAAASANTTTAKPLRP